MVFKKSYLILLLISLSLQKNFVSYLQDDFAIKLDPSFDQSKAVKDTGSIQFDDSIQGQSLIGQMGFGWNLGNTFDAYDDKYLPDQGLSSEECWGNPKTTEAIIDGLIKKGFKTIRIPVSWHNHLVDNRYTVDPEWTKRVKTVVDMCIAKGLVVILNTHHDQADNNVSYGKGYYPNRNNREESQKFLFNIWSQITLAFNNGYGHKLIFEPLNEPRLKGDTHEWWYAAGDGNCEECVQSVNEYNKLIHHVIRSSGGNNAKRFILFTSCAAAPGYVLSGGMSIPDDSRYNSNKRVLISAHMYSPYDFAMNPDMSKAVFNDGYRNELEQGLRALNERFVNQGISVIIGEMGVINKNNLDQRKSWAKFYVETAKRLGIACIVWDNGYWGEEGKSAEETFGLYHRTQGTWEPDDLVSTYIQAAR
jgi:endoglucanase